MKVKKTILPLHESDGIMFRWKQKNIRRELQKKKNVFCSKKAVLINNCFEGCNRILEGCFISNSSLGYGTYICENSRIYDSIIGRYTSIASNFLTVQGHHPKNEFISTSPVFYSKRFGGSLSYVSKDYFDGFKYADEKRRKAVAIGNDVWIGADVKIMEGVTIEDGAIIGAGAVVTKDVEPYAIYAGIPAKKIGQRFDDNEIEKLLELKWWNKGEKWIMKNAELFSEPSDFFSLLEKENRGNV